MSNNSKNRLGNRKWNYGVGSVLFAQKPHGHPLQCQCKSIWVIAQQSANQGMVGYRPWSSWWINFCKDLIARGVLDTSNTHHLECLWFCFSPVLKKGLEEIKDSWSCHYVRKSWYYTQAGIPNQLYLLPEIVGAEDFKKEYDGCDLIEIEDSVNVSTENYSTYQEYFSYSAGVLGIGQMQTWRDALAAYERLLEAA